MAAPPDTTVHACAKMVEVATKACQTPPSAPAPQWDAIAVSLAQQANAISFGAAILGGLALISAVAWAFFVRGSAQEEARKTAEEEVRKIAPAIIDAWLTTEGIAILRQANQMSAPSISPTDGDVADQIAANAGDPQQ